MIFTYFKDKFVATGQSIKNKVVVTTRSIGSNTNNAFGHMKKGHLWSAAKSGGRAMLGVGKIAAGTAVIGGAAALGGVAVGGGAVAAATALGLTGTASAVVAGGATVAAGAAGAATGAAAGAKIVESADRFVSKPKYDKIEIKVVSKPNDDEIKEPEEMQKLAAMKIINDEMNRMQNEVKRMQDEAKRMQDEAKRTENSINADTEKINKEW